VIHHVQLACPPGSEPALREFYVTVLGASEIPKPEPLAGQGGVWFRLAGPGGDAELHLGVEDDFRPARPARRAALAWGSRSPRAR